MAPPPLHQSLAALAFLLGQWEGPGAGSYPTIDDFTYVEHLSFGHVGKPFLSYAQRSWDPTTRAGMHVESGYLRPVGAAGVEMVVSQPTGITEVLEGTVEDGTVTLRTVEVGRTATAKEVRTVTRELSLDGVDLRIGLAMAAVGRPLTHHLASRLSPVSD